MSQLQKFGKGFSEKLTAHLKVRINFIFEKSKIPLFNIDDYIINRKLGEGSFGLIYSVFKKSEPFKEYALKKELDEIVELNDKKINSLQNENIVLADELKGIYNSKRWKLVNKLASVKNMLRRK